MSDGIKVDWSHLAGKHVCEALAKTDPHFLTIDEKDRLVIVANSVFLGSTVIWFKIEFCPFCGVKL